jgi:hypothetical protein
MRKHLFPIFSRATLLAGAGFLLLQLANPAAARAQKDSSAAEAAVAQVKQATTQGIPLVASTNVNGNVSVEAVLLPPRISKHVFGGIIGNDYAVIALTLSNRSASQSLIVHSIFLDYSRWALSGYSPEADGGNEDCTRAARNRQAANSKKEGNPGEPAKCNAIESWQTQTKPNQVASAEVRIVRGELLDHQPWTKRNWILRALQTAGSIASAYTFTLESASHAVQSIGAVNGQVIPALQNFWPDPTVGQMNRISDLGFQVNKVIPKQSSDIVVAFFPIDKFLTSGLRNLYIKSPALFYVPLSLLVDPKAESALRKYIGPFLSDKEDLSDLDQKLESLRNALPRILAGDCQKDSLTKDFQYNCSFVDFINRVSLNTIRITVGGTMAVDVDSIPATIDSIEITTAGADAAKLWTTKGQEIDGIIHGSFLSGGNPEVVEASSLGITGPTRVDDGSTDKQLKFKMTLTAALPATQKKLTFKVVKTTSENATVESGTKDYSLPQLTAPAQPPAQQKDSATNPPPQSPSHPAAGATGQPSHNPEPQPAGPAKPPGS